MNKADRIKTDAKRKAKKAARWATRIRAGKPVRGAARNKRRVDQGINWRR